MNKLRAWRVVCAPKQWELIFFKAWRSPAQDYTNLLNCEVPRRTAAIYSKTVKKLDIRCQRHVSRKP